MKLKKTVMLSFVTSSLVVASGYKIPEQSLNSMALGAAYVAHTTDADSAYFNPANMSFMEDYHFFSGGLTLAHLPSVEYTLMAPYSGESKEENILIPNFHYVAKAMGNLRWGVSVTAPGGLTKRWDTPYQKMYAEEFTLKNVEINPVLAYRISDNFSIGGGLRFVYSEGVVHSDGGDIAPIKREMEGDSFNFGYNLAMTYKPTSDINLAVTYRSTIDLKEEGEANLYFGGIGRQYDASVTVPLPAALNIAISKTWEDRFTLEFNYERTYWSDYETLDFNYGSTILSPLQPIFDAPLARDWVDTDTYRIGATIEMDSGITAMFGFAIDENPVPSKTIGFELPDSDAKIFSMGFSYQQTKNLSWGMAFLLDAKESRSIKAGEAENMILANGGGFSGGGAYLTTVGVSYKY
ncbi:MAG: outer membrane protein transport protein [Campylobacterota bacterium]|nr:outer membrane protein transport protein [Campylobacterota bacterium]